MRMLEEAGDKLVCPLRMVFPADGGWQRDYRVSSSSSSGSGSSNSACLLAGVGCTGYGNVAGIFFQHARGMEGGGREDGGRTEVMCNYDLDLLCNTYLYLISILGGFGQQGFVHLCIWTSGGPTAQILKSQFGPKIWCDLHHDLCHDLSHDLSAIWATVNAPNVHFIMICIVSSQYMSNYSMTNETYTQTKKFSLTEE